MVNVQTFAAAGAAVGSLPWLAAWLLDPMVSLALIAVLRAEQITARWQVDMRTVGTGPWVKRTKVFAFAATYTMNTWQSWSELDVDGIVLHSVPPAMVYLVAETGPILRDRLTEAVLRAARPMTGTDSSTATHATSTQDAEAATAGASTVQVRKPAKRTASKPRKPRRTSRQEYLNRARAAHRPGIVVTPAWVREVVPEISRGTSQVVSNELNAELQTNHHVAPAAAPTTVPAADEPTEQGRAA
jgi:hypothetical protein